MKPTKNPLIIQLSPAEIHTGYKNLSQLGDPGVFIGDQITPDGLVSKYAIAPRLVPSGAAHRIESNLGVPIVQETSFQPTLVVANLIRGLGSLAGVGAYEAETEISRFNGLFNQEIGETSEAVRATTEMKLGSLNFVLDFSLPAGTRQGRKGAIFSPAILKAQYDTSSRKAYCAKLISPAVRLSQSGK